MYLCVMMEMVKKPQASLRWKGKTMEKYTDLEQALQDPSLVIITDKISSLMELNRAETILQLLFKRISGS